jgi:Egh16-like virulence factor
LQQGELRRYDKVLAICTSLKEATSLLHSVASKLYSYTPLIVSSTSVWTDFHSFIFLSQFQHSTMLSLALLSLTSLVSAHGLITAAKGNAGGSGSGLGFVPGSSGTSQADVTVFKGTSVCGQTAAGGVNSISTGTQNILNQVGGQLPQVTPGGSLSMTLHQVNGDGAGPYSCGISSDATGATFSNLQVTTQVPGTNGVSGASNKDFPLVVSMPAGLQCTGTVAGQSNVCLVRCKNTSGGGKTLIQLWESVASNIHF